MSAAAKFHDLVSGRRRGAGAALARLALSALSLPYGVGMRLKNRLFDAGWRRAHRAGVPVVSVGNLTLGGTGKTPCVEYLARFYRERDVRVVILSRGYGGEGGRNDEALVLEENLPDVPHLQGTDRVALAAVAVGELEAELVILDDGFQHRRLARDLDVVLLDATDPFGHGRLFPRGLLREPPSSLRRADAVLLTRCDQVSEAAVNDLIDRVRRLAPDRPVVAATHAPVAWLQHGRPDRPVDALRGRPVAAFCGIGNPDAFRRTLGEVGDETVAFRMFPDHHAYTRADVDDLRVWARQQPADAALVTTQKDLVKLRIDCLGERDLLALRVGLHVRAGPDADAFHRRLAAVAAPGG
ncbi:MAG TPA: tetraacyldisaccharide 4'-kinase [Gemmataceae bacterium]